MLATSRNSTFGTLSSVINSVSLDLIPIILCPLSLSPSPSLHALCYLFSTPPVALIMLIHRVTKLRTMEPLGDRAHPQPNIQEYIDKASLTAARQKEGEGVGFWDHT